MRFCAIHSSELGDVTEKSVKEAGLLNHAKDWQMVTIGTDVQVIKAFKKIFSRDVQALPVVDADGKLVGTVSPSDVRGLTVHTLKDLLLPVSEFLAKRCYGKMRKPITVKATDSVYKAMNVCTIGKVHRVWVVDDHQKPIGCVSLSDMITLFSKFNFKAPAFV